MRTVETSALAGMAGLEPANEGVKVPCLTAWLHPCIVPLTGLEPAMKERRLLLRPPGRAPLRYTPFRHSGILSMRARISTSHTRTLNPLHIGISGPTVYASTDSQAHCL